MGLLDVPAYSRGQSDVRFAGRVALRRRDIPGPAALPLVAPSLPGVATATFSPGTQTSASTIQGAVWLRPRTHGSIATYTGCNPTAGSLVGGSLETIVAGMYTNTSTPPFAKEFMWDAAPATTIISASNGASLPQSTINVASTSGFPKVGSATVVTDAGVQTVTYTGVTTTTLTGCSGGTGAMATGNAVAPTTVSLEILTKDATTAAIRVILDGYALSKYATATAPGNSGNPVRTVLSGIAPGRHRVKIEYGSSTFDVGIVAGPTDAFRPVNPPKLRVLVIGDSFAEPTVQDSSTLNVHRGFPQALATLLNADVWACGSGGTGYLNPGTGGRVKFRDRLAADVIPFAPDVVMWAGGLNDYGYAGYSQAVLQAEVTACFAQITAALPNCQQIVLSPFHPHGRSLIPAALLGASDAIAAAATAAGLTFLDLLRSPLQTPAQPSGVSVGITSPGATISSSVSFNVGTILQIDSGPLAELRQVSGVSGSGPYTLSVTDDGQQLIQTHAAGVPIKQVGDTYVTGAGTQTAPGGDGTSDRYTGSDNTHPTMEGHINLALAIYFQIILRAVA